MAKPRRAQVIAVLIAALAFAGCATTLQKKDRRKGFGGTPVKNLEARDVPVHGHQVDVEVLEGRGVSGELLSVSKNHIVVLKDGKEVHVPRDRVKYVEVLDIYDAYGEVGAGWVALGAISTISHGLIAILSLPVWLVAGVPTVIIGSQINDVDFEDDELHKLRQFARFAVAPDDLPRRPKPRPPETGRFVPKEHVETSTTAVEEEPGGPRLEPIEEQDHQR